MKSLDRKLARDLWSLKTQVLSIALVIGRGLFRTLTAIGLLLMGGALVMGVVR